MFSFIQIPVKSSHIKVKSNGFIIVYKTLHDLVPIPFPVLYLSTLSLPHSAKTTYSLLCCHFHNIHLPSGKSN